MCAFSGTYLNVGFEKKTKKTNEETLLIRDPSLHHQVDNVFHTVFSIM